MLWLTSCVLTEALRKEWAWQTGFLIYLLWLIHINYTWSGLLFSLPLPQLDTSPLLLILSLTVYELYKCSFYRLFKSMHTISRMFRFTFVASFPPYHCPALFHHTFPFSIPVTLFSFLLTQLHYCYPIMTSYFPKALTHAPIQLLLLFPVLTLLYCILKYLL